MADNIITLDEKVETDIPAVRLIIRFGAVPVETADSSQLLSHLRLLSHRSLYASVLEELSSATRNTPAQLEYFDAYEKALSVFRTAAYELRVSIDVLGLEQRLETLQNSLSEKEAGSDDLVKLKGEIAEAIMFSNRYALFFAGNVGLALLDASPVQSNLRFSFGTNYDASKDMDSLASQLVQVNNKDFQRIAEEKRGKEEKMTDDDLKYTLECIFTSWTGQFQWQTFGEIAARRGIDSAKLQYGGFSVQAGQFSRKTSAVIDVDSRFMDNRRSDIIGSEEYVQQIWNSMMKLVSYKPDLRKNAFKPAGCIFTYGEPGGGKTFIAHALVRELEGFCSENSLPLLALVHSTTDYASEYQNKTANKLAELAEKINAFSGPVVMYVSDADNIFQSRKDSRLTPEQRQTLSVYFGMFDGTLIKKKEGKFMAIMDANYIDGIDDATKSRVFDMICELKRFERPQDFAELVRRQLVGDSGVNVLSEAEWMKIGNYVLGSGLSNREIGYVIGDIKGDGEVTKDIVLAPYKQQVSFANNYLHTISVELVIDRFNDYASRRVQIEEASRRAMVAQSAERFYTALATPAKDTAEAS